MVKHLFKFFGAAFLAMFFGLGVQVLYAQNFSYRDPTCGPNSSGAGGTWPDCNVAAPLNQGSTPQIKTGDIDLLGGDFSANTISADLVIPQILDVQTDATILGRLGVGVVAPSALLDVRGGGNILIKPTDRSGITQFGGVPNLGGLRGIATVDVHGNLNVREVPVETATGYFYQRVFADNSVFNSAYNGTTPDFSWWKTDPKIGPEFENAASWDAIKLTNSRTNSTCDDGDILDEQCDSAASIVATASAPSVAYD
ncbi:MAG: hypothetical protein COV34_03080, partial [Candidatus Zambryskibacteria bacterium CG10_big_fil_rev_8_21_14_0_10_42_12]